MYVCPYKADKAWDKGRRLNAGHATPVESRWSGADPRSAGVGAGVYANNAPLRARGGAAVEQIVENYQDQFELILIWFMQRRDGDGSGE